MSVDKEKLQKEIDFNYGKFKEMAFTIEDSGKFAVIKSGKLIEVMTERGDAVKMGNRLFEDRVFSIQEIRDEKEDLGFMSYTLC